MRPLLTVMAEDRRRAILAMLAEMPVGSLNETILKGGLDRIGHRIGSDRIRADLAWLDQHGLVAIERVPLSGNADSWAARGELWVARLTRDGQDVAEGRRDHPGIARPDAP